ncbi:CopD family protein [Rhizobium sp. KVB221]|uniref:Protoporphyrinogen IX oxidase n=1 Tax=Rhizobium setariae TaxID=2801340 RepID=A0A936YVJ9_9HYPH|nr:CopD family protein [Rhizobium setariae]MBL0374536.1 CopD family protein [Rhizobium setariae]
MDYFFWLKAAHLVAVFIFIGGMILNGFLLRYLRPGVQQLDAVISAARFWNGPIIGFALLLVWVLGLTLAYLASYFAAPWLMAKMALVFLLSGIHGAQAAAFRKMQQIPAQPVSAFLRNSALVTMIFVAAIVLLVILQPF